MGDEEGFAFFGAIDFLAFFGESDDGDAAEAEALEFGHGHGELAFAAVDDDEVGEGDEFRGLGFWDLFFEAAEGFEGRFLGEVGVFAEGFFAFDEDAGEAAADDFGHGDEVVLTGGGADAVAAVVGVVGDAIFEADHGGDAVGGADVGDVEALHHERWAVEVEFLLEFADIGHGVDGGDDFGAGATLEGAGGFEGFFEVGDHVPKFGGALEVELGGVGLHFLFESREEVLRFAGEEVAGFVEAAEVVVPGDAADAGGGTVFDDVVGAVFVIDFAGVDGAADAEAEAFGEPVHGGAESTGVGEGAEVAGAVVFFQAGEGEAGEGVVEGEADEEEAFVVAEADVVAGAELFDEFAFEEEGFGFVADEVEVEVPDAVDESACFAVGEFGAGGGEVVGEAFAEVAGFADVDDAIEAVAHDVDTRLVRDVVETGTEVGFFTGEHGKGVWG